MPLKAVKEQGFAMVNLRDETRSGRLASWSSQPLSVLVILAVHANEKHRAWPSLDTIAELGGISKSSVRPALKWLEEKDKIRLTHGSSFPKYRVLPHEDGADVSIRRGIVRSKLWAALTPTARKLYLVLQSFSLPGIEPFYFEGSKHGDWDEAVQDGLDPESGRHVLAEHIITARLARCCGVTSRAVCMAKDALIKWDLAKLPEDEEFLILPNQPGSISWLSESENEEVQPRPSISPAAKRSIKAWRKRQRCLADPQTNKVEVPRAEKDASDREEFRVV